MGPKEARAAEVTIIALKDKTNPMVETLATTDHTAREEATATIRTLLISMVVRDRARAATEVTLEAILAAARAISNMPEIQTAMAAVLAANKEDTSPPDDKAVGAISTRAKEVISMPVVVETTSIPVVVAGVTASIPAEVATTSTQAVVGMTSTQAVVEMTSTQAVTTSTRVVGERSKATLQVVEVKGTRQVDKEIGATTITRAREDSKVRAVSLVWLRRLLAWLRKPLVVTRAFSVFW